MTSAERQRRRRAGLAIPKGGFMAQVIRALPQTRQALVERRKLKKKITIVDLVDPIVVALWEDEKFGEYMKAVEDSGAVEGSIDVDDTMAAMMIREYAKENKMTEVAKENLTTIRYGLRRVLNRYHVARHENVTDADKKETAE
jgi:hypothetical protein